MHKKSSNNTLLKTVLDIDWKPKMSYRGKAPPDT